MEKSVQKYRLGRYAGIFFTSYAIIAFAGSLSRRAVAETAVSERAVSERIDASAPVQLAQAVASPETGTSLEDVRSRLTDLETLPLFLPPERGTLESADDRLSATQLSRPSFAWIRDQVASRYSNDINPGEIVSQWQAYTTTDGFKYVDVVVNETRWERLSYFKRYGFTVQFGTVTNSYGYQLRVFHTGDAANRNDALSLSNRNDTVVASSIRLRGAYFCAPSTDLTPVCDTIITPEDSLEDN